MREPLVIPQKSQKQRVGAVAMIDALAFKGIWDRFGFDDVLARLKHIEAEVQEERNRQEVAFPKFAAGISFDLQVRFLSDTIVIAASSRVLLQTTKRASLLADDDSGAVVAAALSTEAAALRKVQEFVALKTVIAVCLASLKQAIEGMADFPMAPSLNYRGAIAYGQYLVDGNFLIGKAVDDCGELFEKPDGAFVVLHESAKQFVHECWAAQEHLVPSNVSSGKHTVEEAKDYLRLCGVVEYNVPVKGNSFYLPVLNPLAGFERGDWPEKTEQILSQMQAKESDSDELKAGIASKHRHTSDFLMFVIANAEPCTQGESE